MKILIIFWMLSIPITLYAPPIDLVRPVDKMEQIFRAMSYVESRGNHQAVNQHEQAYGIVQIRGIRLKDYYRRTGIRYSLPEMKDSVKAREVWQYYAELNKTTEKIIKKWNGSGPMAERYYKLVINNLNQ